MIEQLGVKNFKCLKEVDLEPKKLNLLAGLNGMGKSSLIQVLLLLKQSPGLAGGELSLNGSMVQIGKGKDALYEFAPEEKIDIRVKVKGHFETSWSFFYDPAGDKMYTKANGVPEDTNIFQVDFEEDLKEFQYIGAHRLGPQTVYDTSAAAIKAGDLGVQGEYTAHYLHLVGNKYKVPSILKHERTEELTLINQVNGWMGEISPGVKLNVIEVPHIDKLLLNYQFELKNGRTGSYKTQNVGFGISYALPIVVALLTSRENSIIIIENPESHIHPRGQAELGKLMALAAENGAQLFVETHSDHIVNGIRVAVKEQLVNKDKVNILYFDKVTTEEEQYSSITPVKLDKQGELSEYPDNFLDEWNNQLLRLL